MSLPPLVMGAAMQDDPGAPNDDWECGVIDVVTAAQLGKRKAPPRSFVVDPLVPDRTVSSIYGDGGAGKSLLALHMMVCVVLGRPWMGMQTVRGPALFLSAEDEQDEVHRRLEKIAAHERIALSALADLHILPLATRDAVLAVIKNDGIQPTPLWHQLDRIIARVLPRIVVLDTLADIFSGRELDRVHARAFIGMLRRAALKHGLGIVVLAHPSKTGTENRNGTSGSTGWSNSVRSRSYLEIPERDDDGNDARILTLKKANYAELDFKIRLRWRDGLFVRETEEMQAERAAAESAKSSVADEVFLTAFRELSELGEVMSPKPGRNYAPTKILSRPEARRVRKKAIQEAMGRLIAAGAIVIEEYGPPSKPKTRLVLGR